VRLGVIGVGTFGINHLRAFKQLEYEGDFKLVAAADLDEERLEVAQRDFGAKGYADYREMLEREELDGVSIATPDFLHRQIALDVLESGRHVLVEKPMDVTVEGCVEMMEKARAKDLLLQVDFHKRYDPYHIELRRMVQSGGLGEPLYGYVHMEDRIEVPRDWFPGWASGSSPVWFLGIHFYDLARWVLSSNGRSVYAKGREVKLAQLGVETYDSVQAQVEFENGCVITFDTSWIIPDGFESIVNQGIRLVGTEGLVEVDTQDRGMRSCLLKDGGMKTYNLGFMHEEVDNFGRAIRRGYGIESIEHFARNVDYLKDGGSLKDIRSKYPDGEDGLEATRIGCAVDESLRQGREIEIGGR